MNTISVIVPAYNAEGTIALCVESLLRQTRHPVEIIVVDDASTDRTPAVAAGCGARVIRLHENRGPGVARNAGAKHAVGDILAFTDSDCVAPPDWLERIAAAVDVPGVVAATGGYAGPVRESFLVRLQHLIIRQRQERLPSEIESAITSNFACRAIAFREVGGFPLYSRRRAPGRPIWGNEDEEIGFLLAKRGKIRWLADVGVMHAFRRDIAGYLRQQSFYAERIVMSHFRFPDMAASRTNYSRLSGFLHLLATFGVAVGGLGVAAALAACEPVHWPAQILDGLTLKELVCSAGAGLLAVSLPAYALLPVGSLRRLRQAGERMWFLARAYPVLLAVDVAWLYGAVRGTLMSIGGFEDGHRESRAAPAASDR